MPQVGRKFVAALFALIAAPLHAATFTVTTVADVIDAAASCPAVNAASLPGPDGVVSLREAVCAANNIPGEDTILFGVDGVFGLTGPANEDNGNSGDLDIKQSLTIVGNGTSRTVIDGRGIERIFDVFPSASSTFSLTAVTLQNGDTRTNSFKEGGAIYLHNNVTTSLAECQVINNFSGANGAIENRGSLTITNCRISGNQTIPSSGTVVGGGIHSAGPTSIIRTTISDNSVQGEGGGIAVTVAPGVVVNIDQSTISNNTASAIGGGLGNGGGISTTGNQGTINIRNSTLSGNSAANLGGGAYWVTPAGETGNVTLTNVTVTNNTADFDSNGTGAGGGFAQTNASVTLHNTIVAGNFKSNPATRDDIAGAVLAASSSNLIGSGTGSSGITNGVNGNQVGSIASPINALLGILANNGGPTETHALSAGSPAVDQGNNAVCPAIDQRGHSRPTNGVCDIGAFEMDVDITPPDTTITSAPTGVSASTTATFSFAGSDNVSIARFECALDGGAFATCTSPRTYSGLTAGSHTFQVRAVDTAGLVDPTPASYTWIIDTTAPDTTITSAPANPSASTTATFSFAGSDNVSIARFECALDGGAFATCTSPRTYSGLTAGSHTFQVRAVDTAGLVDPTPASYTWSIDTTAPDTTITEQPANPSASDSATFAFTGSDAGGVARFECSLDGAAFATCTSPHTLSGLSAGSHTFEVRAVDTAGHVDPTPASYTWSIDAGSVVPVPTLNDWLRLLLAGVLMVPTLRAFRTVHRR